MLEFVNRFKDRYNHLSQREQGLLWVLFVAVIGGVIFLIYSSLSAKLSQFSDRNDRLRVAVLKIQENRPLYIKYQNQNKTLESRLTKEPLRLVTYTTNLLSTYQAEPRSLDAQKSEEISKDFQKITLSSVAPQKTMSLQGILALFEAIQSDANHIVQVSALSIEVIPGEQTEFQPSFDVTTYTKSKPTETKPTTENQNKPENGP